MNVKKVSIGIVGWIIKIVFIILIVMIVYKFSTQAYELGFQVFSDETMSGLSCDRRKRCKCVRRW